MSVGPLLVYGPRSLSYDFGPQHPLTPRRFGPGIDLLRTLGAEPGLAPEPADDRELLAVHTERYLATVRRLSADPGGRPEAGFAAYGDDPPFAGMHEAAAMVAGGSLRAMDAILRGDVEHAFHPGGGLHHALPERASGFCIYNDPALAIAAARQAGQRVMYIDLDVHHGDGVQAIHSDDPGVLTISIHESGRTLFPGTGFPDERGEGAAAGTVVNLPLEAETGETAWLAGVRGLLPQLAATFGPDLIVSQHGADSHAWDPLAHLRVTTTAMGEAARLVDALAHRHAQGRWLATGGGGYDVYRVVPRTWALTWLAGAHREVPQSTDAGWRSRWVGDALRYDQSPPPERFDDQPNAGLPSSELQRLADARSLETLAAVRAAVLPRLLIVAEERGWWDPMAGSWRPSERPGPPPEAATIIDDLDAALLDRVSLAPGAGPLADPEDSRRLLRAALQAGARASGAVSGEQLLGVAVVASSPDGGDAPDLLWAGVAPDRTSPGLAAALARSLTEGRVER
ncbi:MAG TPA: acetoin utilization protein AcuC [Candidatus Limnocylindrales bacterium]|nr:acetoin utilization protein AcuC [Candidatus Limnocylindrales bacterium]